MEQKMNTCRPLGFADLYPNTFKKSTNEPQSNLPTNKCVDVTNDGNFTFPKPGSNTTFSNTSKLSGDGGVKTKNTVNPPSKIINSKATGIRSVDNKPLSMTHDRRTVISSKPNVDKLAAHVQNNAQKKLTAAFEYHDDYKTNPTHLMLDVIEFAIQSTTSYAATVTLNSIVHMQHILFKSDVDVVANDTLCENALSRHFAGFIINNEFVGLQYGNQYGYTPLISSIDYLPMDISNPLTKQIVIKDIRANVSLYDVFALWKSLPESFLIRWFKHSCSRCRAVNINPYVTLVSDGSEFDFDYGLFTKKCNMHIPPNNRIYVPDELASGIKLLRLLIGDDAYISFTKVSITKCDALMRLIILLKLRVY